MLLTLRYQPARRRIGGRALLYTALYSFLLCLSGQSWSAEDNPYFVDKKSFKKSIRKIAISPLEIAPIFDLSDAQISLIEAEITRRLEKKKFAIVPIEQYRNLRELMSDQVGGLRDSDGELNAERVIAVWDHSQREMFLQHEVDAIANISIRAVTASFADDRAEWDGVKQKVKHKGDGLAALLTGSKNYSGTIAAASLQLHFTGRDGAVAYLARGGINVLQRREGSKLIPHMEDVFDDEKRLNKAIKIAVDKL